MKWLMVVVVLLGETLGGPVAVPAPFPAGTNDLFLGSVFGPWWKLDRKMSTTIVLSWLEVVMVPRKHFSICSALVQLFLVRIPIFQGSNFCQFMAYWSLQRGGRIHQRKMRIEEKLLQIQWKPANRPKYFWHRTKSLLLLGIKLFD